MRCRRDASGCAHRHPPPRLPACLQALLALVGSTACVTFSYLFPAALVIKCQRHPAVRASAGGMAALGALMAAVALWDQLQGRGE